MFGALLGLAGGLFKASSAKKQNAANNAANAEAQELQNQYNTEAAALERANSLEDMAESYSRLRKSAESAGFNPLSAMSVGGIGGFAQAASGVGQKGVVAKLASPSLIGNVISGVGDIVTSIEAAKAQEKLTKQQLERVQDQRTLGDTPKVKKTVQETVRRANTAPKKTSLPSLGEPPKRPADPTIVNIPKLEAGNLMVTNPSWVGTSGQTYVDPRVPDAEHAEQRYGDFAQEAVGATNIWRDNAYNSKIMDVSKKAGRLAANQVHHEMQQNPTLDLDRVIERTVRANTYLPQGPSRRAKVGVAKKQREFMRENYPTVFD